MIIISIAHSKYLCSTKVLTANLHFLHALYPSVCFQCVIQLQDAFVIHQGQHSSTSVIGRSFASLSSSSWGERDVDDAAKLNAVLVFVSLFADSNAIES
jgi:hypothetical protein